MEEDLGNLRTALRWSLSGSVGQGLQLATALGLSRYWLRWRHYSEGREALAQLLGRYPKRDALRANGLTSLARILDAIGEESAATAALDEAVEIARSMGDRVAVMYSLRAIGLLVGRGGSHAEAISLYREALELARELQDDREIAGIVNLLAVSFLGLGEPAIARHWLQEGLPLARQVGNPALLCAIIGTAGELAMRQGALVEAVSLYQESARVALDVGNDEFLSDIMVSMGEVAVATGQPELALILAGAADAVRQKNGSSWDRPSGASIWNDLVSLAGRNLHPELVSARLLEGRDLSRERAIALVLK